MADFGPSSTPSKLPNLLRSHVDFRQYFFGKNPSLLNIVRLPHLRGLLRTPDLITSELTRVNFPFDKLREAFGTGGSLLRALDLSLERQ
jgi:hypothetical protein